MANSVATGKVSSYTDLWGQVIGRSTTSELTTKYPGYTLKTPTKTFAFPYRGHMINFLLGHPVMLDAATLSALTAASAPLV